MGLQGFKVFGAWGLGFRVWALKGFQGVGGFGAVAGTKGSFALWCLWFMGNFLSGAMSRETRVINGYNLF